MIGFENYESEEEEEEETGEFVSDLLIAAKFANMDMLNSAVSAAAAGEQDPCEIDLDDVPTFVLPRKPEMTGDEDDSSSSSSSSSESEEEPARHRMEQMEGENEDSEMEEDLRESNTNYVPFLDSSKASALPDMLAETDIIVPNALVITSLQMKSGLIVASAPSKLPRSGSGKGDILDSGTVICTADRRVLGRIDDVFGPVDLPHYTIVCDEQKLVDLAVQVGDFLARVENLTQLVNFAQLDRHGIDLAEGEEDEEEDSEDEAAALPKSKPAVASTAAKAPASKLKPRPGKNTRSGGKRKPPPKPIAAPPPPQQQQFTPQFVSPPQLPTGWPQPQQQLPPNWPA